MVTHKIEKEPEKVQKKIVIKSDWMRKLVI